MTGSSMNAHVCQTVFACCVACCYMQSQLQLTFLCLGGLCVTDFQAEALANFSTLRELELFNAPELTPDGVAHLTALRQLTRLELNGVGYRRCIECRYSWQPSKSEVSLLWGPGVGWQLF